MARSEHLRANGGEKSQRPLVGRTSSCSGDPVYFTSGSTSRRTKKLLIGAPRPHEIALYAGDPCAATCAAGSPCTAQRCTSRARSRELRPFEPAGRREREFHPPSTLAPERTRRGECSKSTG
jgi:hypothetical protein